MCYYFWLGREAEPPTYREYLASLPSDGLFDARRWVDEQGIGE